MIMCRNRHCKSLHVNGNTLIGCVGLSVAIKSYKCYQEIAFLSVSNRHLVSRSLALNTDFGYWGLGVSKPLIVFNTFNKLIIRTTKHASPLNIHSRNATSWAPEWPFFQFIVFPKIILSLYINLKTHSQIKVKCTSPCTSIYFYFIQIYSTNIYHIKMYYLNPIMAMQHWI